MKTNITHHNQSTYSLLIRSEDKERNLSETFVYLMLGLSTVFSIWQFGQQPLNIPANSETRSPSFAQAAVTPGESV